MTSQKSRNHHPERVILTNSSLSLVTGWLEAVGPHLRGSSLSRSDVVNWLIGRQPPQLVADSIREISDRVFDPVKALSWASAEIARKQKSGEDFDVNVFMADVLLKPQPPKPQSKKKIVQQVEISNGKVATQDR